MNPPTPDVSPENARRVADTIEFAAKLALALGAVWAFLAKVAKPLVEWRRRTRAASIRAALAPELTCIAGLPSLETKLDRAIQRQDQVFEEIDLFVSVVADLRDRADEITEMLNEVGFASHDRRVTDERRREADAAMAELQGKLRGRRRREDQLEVPG